MPITVGTGAGEYPPTVQFVTNGEPADDLTFNRPTQDVADRTSAIKTCLDAFPITEVVGLAAALAGAAPLNQNLVDIASLDYGANPNKIFAVDGAGVATLIDNTLQGENNTASNIGTGVGLFESKNLLDLRFKSLVAGTNISLVPSADEIQIVAAPGEITQLTKLVKNTTGLTIPAGSVVAWLDDGTVALADANIMSLSDFCGITKGSISHGDFGLVVKMGNIPALIAGLGATVGAYIYMGEAPGTMSLVPPPFIGENSIIILGRAEPPDGIATAVAGDLFLQPAYISEGGL